MLILLRKKNNANKYPILQSAGLNNVGSVKGGEYSEGGAFPNTPFTSQWTKVNIIDNGNDYIGVHFTCYRWNYIIKTETVLVDYMFVRNLSGKKHITKSTYSKEKHELNIEKKWQNISSISIIDYLGKIYYKTSCNRNANLNVYGEDVTSIKSIDIPSGNYFLVVKMKETEDIVEIEI